MNPISTPTSVTMSVNQTLALLSDQGCRDITSQLDESNTTILPTLTGGQANIHKGKLNDGTDVAVKIIRMTVPSNPSRKERKKLKRVALELCTWTRCSHPNILELTGMAIFHDNLAMISPWISNGSLDWFLSQNPEIDRYAMCAQVAEAVAYMHMNQIVHGDIKCGSFLVSHDQVAKLKDCGSLTLKRVYTLKFEDTTERGESSLRWAAPELIALSDKEKAKTNLETDIYALGMTFLEIMSGKVPYHHIESDFAVMNCITNHKFPERPEGCMAIGNQQADPLWLLMKETWTTKPKRRPKANAVRDMINQIKNYSPPLRDRSSPDEGLIVGTDAPNFSSSTPRTNNQESVAPHSENRDGRLTSRDVDQLAASFEGLGISQLTHSSQDHPSGAAQPLITWFEVPRGGRRLNKTEADQLVADFKAGPGKNTKEARCSLCYHEGKVKDWNTRPANLRRHLYAHFEIKCYGCLVCDAQFTTRDQAVVHARDHHTVDKSRESAKTYVYPLFPEQKE
ncbi:Tyrosine-protein kinase FRK OS=Homo sapiens GN=FRK PE=1 SV=1 [Rhizoctonia solani AG-1 IB]|uniref:Tyrosine-protein kinase FRK n=1 Tax=Thanatephorus cucumeris (strain AG1-IB / isolate 7/3/14) TaxID=1108050 RepID=A0A0B7FZ98_THACB|nr:Tyrosine-protein kinase FRK OS=Homo sapiens GN=FRK PE=1 SV=1 [Rhizoctonia solani AG-1 IB]